MFSHLPKERKDQNAAGGLRDRFKAASQNVPLVGERLKVGLVVLHSDYDSLEVAG